MKVGLLRSDEVVVDLEVLPPRVILVCLRLHGRGLVLLSPLSPLGPLGLLLSLSLLCLQSLALLHVQVLDALGTFCHLLLIERTPLDRAIRRQAALPSPRAALRY